MAPSEFSQVAKISVDISLYTTKPLTYASLYNMGERGAQKIFKRGFARKERVPANVCPDYADWPVFMPTPTQIRMLTPYFNELERQHGKANNTNNANKSLT